MCDIILALNLRQQVKTACAVYVKCSCRGEAVIYHAYAWLNQISSLSAMCTVKAFLLFICFSCYRTFH